MKKLFSKLIRSLGYEVIKAEEHYILPKKEITYAYDLLYTSHSCDFMNNKKFIESYNLGKSTDVNKTVLNNYDIYWRIHVLCWAATVAKNLEGDFADCGVNTGIFSRAIINYIDFNSTNKTYYLLDTFKGLDEKYSTEKEYNSDLNKKYRLNENTLYEQVKETFRGFNVKIIKGAIPDTLSQVRTEKIAFLSIDMNSMQPEVEALNFFWDKMVPGGIIILDDYGFANKNHEQKIAHDSFAKSKNVEVLSLPTCQGLIIKS